MYFYLLIIFSSFFIVSCNNPKDYDIEINKIEDRLAQISSQLNDLNLDIERLDKLLMSTFERLQKQQTDSINSSFDIQSEFNTIDTLFNNQSLVVDVEKLFINSFEISSLSVLTCTLRSISENKVLRYYKGDKIIIKDDLGNQEYTIQEINKIRRFVRIKNINYDTEFNVYTLDNQ